MSLQSERRRATTGLSRREIGAPLAGEKIFEKICAPVVEKRPRKTLVVYRGWKIFSAPSEERQAMNEELGAKSAPWPNEEIKHNSPAQHSPHSVSTLQGASR